jgi:hypothetical protein
VQALSALSARTPDARPLRQAPPQRDEELREIDRLHGLAVALAEGLGALPPGDDGLRLARALALNVADLIDDARRR